jgi:hypothetical protein
LLVDPDAVSLPEVLPHLRLDELLAELQARLQDVLGARDLMHGLLEAVVAIGSGLDLESTLRRIVETAVGLVDATYGALGVIGDDQRLAEFIPVGLNEDEIRAIHHWPEGRGLLGLLIGDHASASVNEAPSPWLGIPDSLFVSRQRAMIMARFGMRDSMPILAALDEQTSPALQRYRVTLTVTRARMLATIRQPAEAAVLLKQALEGNATVRSVEKMRQILATRRALEQDRGSPEVRELDEVLRRVRAGSGDAR